MALSSRPGRVELVRELQGRGLLDLAPLRLGSPTPLEESRTFREMQVRGQERARGSVGLPGATRRGSCVRCHADVSDTRSGRLEGGVKPIRAR